MKAYKWGITGLCLFLLLLSGIYLFYSLYIIEKMVVLPADVYISKDKMGFNLDPDQVHFGIVKKGVSSSLRFININNNRSYPVEVIVKGKGEIKWWLHSYLKDNPMAVGPLFFLEPGESQDIAVSLFPSEDAEIGRKYTGEIKVIIKRLLLKN